MLAAWKQLSSSSCYWDLLGGVLAILQNILLTVTPHIFLWDFCIIIVNTWYSSKQDHRICQIFGSRDEKWAALTLLTNFISLKKTVGVSLHAGVFVFKAAILTPLNSAEVLSKYVQDCNAHHSSRGFVRVGGALLSGMLALYSYVSVFKFSYVLTLEDLLFKSKWNLKNEEILPTWLLKILAESLECGDIWSV